MARRKSRTSRVSRRGKRSRTSRVSRRGKRSRTSRVQKRSRTQRVQKRSRTSRVQRRGKRSRTLRGGNLIKLILDEPYPWRKEFYRKWMQQSNEEGYEKMTNASTYHVKDHADLIQSWSKHNSLNLMDVVNDLQFGDPPEFPSVQQVPMLYGTYQIQ